MSPVAKQLMTSARTGTGRDDWCTPDVVLDRVRRVGRIALDPCSNANSIVGANISCDEQADGLAHDWRADEDAVVYVNPPYSQLRKWVARCDHEWSMGHNACTIALVPARTDTRAWHEVRPTAVCFWRGRITFVGARAPAPFPSALLCWALGEPLDRFCAAFADAGQVLRVRSTVEAA